MVSPNPAEAGWFSNVLKFITGSGADASQESSLAAVSLPLLGSQTPPPAVGGPVDDSGPALPATQDSALVASRNPAGTLPRSNSDQIVVYTVQPGDTPGSIADNFGVSLNTILWANNISNPNLIKVGDELVILPISGVKYVVKKGDTIESIAKKFKGDAQDILSFNGLAIDEALEAGSEIIIPDGEFTSPPSAPANKGASRFASFPDLIGYFLRPILGGRKTQGIHGYNGVDLANSCGSSVMASAEGSVIIARTGGWNGGYGEYVVIAHPNGVQTLYAHLSKVFVNPGDYINQGTTVGSIGTTGHSTGCHVHFEVRGAKNPF